MYVIVKEYKVDDGKVDAFERAFDPATSARVMIYRESNAYIGSEILRGDADRSRFLAVDRWRSQRAYERFALERADDFTRLEEAAATLTESQRLIGDFTVADEPIGA